MSAEQTLFSGRIKARTVKPMRIPLGFGRQLYIAIWRRPVSGSIVHRSFGAIPPKPGSILRLYAMGGGWTDAHVEAIVAAAREAMGDTAYFMAEYVPAGEVDA